MTPWAAAPLRRRSKRVTKKIARRHGLLHHHWMLERLPQPQPFRSYVLSKRGRPLPALTLGQWSLCISHVQQRRIRYDEIGPYRVSTVFLGLDHAFSPIETTPILYETMVFQDGDSVACDRYTTRLEAVRGHIKMLTTCVNGGWNGDF